MLLLDTPKSKPKRMVDKPHAFIRVNAEDPDIEMKRKNLTDLIALKAARHDRDHEQAGLFFIIGLVISLMMVLIAMEWKFYEPKELVNLGTLQNDFQEILEIPPTEQAPPPPPQKVAPKLVAVSDEVIIKEMEIQIDAEVTQTDLLQDVVFEEVIMEPETEKVEEIFNIVESPATPVGGMDAFYAYVSENMKYPTSALRLGIAGKVFVQFVVEKDGSITDVKVLKGIHEACDAEAIRVVQNAPKWEPGKQRGRPVRVYQRLPIVFIYQEK